MSSSPEIPQSSPKQNQIVEPFQVPGFDAATPTDGGSSILWKTCSILLQTLMDLSLLKKYNLYFFAHEGHRLWSNLISPEIYNHIFYFFSHSRWEDCCPPWHIVAHQLSVISFQSISETLLWLWLMQVFRNDEMLLCKVFLCFCLLVLN